MNTKISRGGKVKRTLIAQAVTTFAKRLLPESYDELDLNVILIRNLYSKEGVKGDVYAVDSEEKYPREFEIRLDSAMNPQALIRALAHEMVHVRQYATGDLVDTEYNYVRWKRRNHAYSDRNYWDQPWEIEAYGMETGLLEHFVKVHKYGRKRWYRDYDYIK